MDKDIGDSSLEFANKYRKAIAKKNPKAIEECENIFREQIKSKGHHVDFANYIIDEQIGLSRKYSFSLPLLKTGAFLVNLNQGCVSIKTC